MKRARRTLAIALVLAMRGAMAQRADVNAITAADDAFGYVAAGDAIGLYDASNVRGFSPLRAGNARIDGMYYDRQARFSDDILASTRIQVGDNAVAFPFASPSGVAR